MAHFGSIFPILGAKVFLENPALSCTTSYGFLAPCQNLEKVNDTIQRKCPDRRKNRWKDRQKATTGGPKRNNASKNLSNGINLCGTKKQKTETLIRAFEYLTLSQEAYSRMRKDHELPIITYIN